ncbi:hypothetical protein ElyMa_002783800 [Elysia marginata]|uniref:Uncharacterized protein n=1 Tax=Elysia marginata TaxID=1093978 RepID=A0AAV4HQV2_9GAST|nr:hypothetical protein ElyMa_002783800 [Elysia marginata]
MSLEYNFYVTVKEVLSTHALDVTNFLLQNKVTIEDDINEIEKRACSDCNKDLTDIELIPLDDMQVADALKEVSPDEVQAICYVAGYVARKHGKRYSNKVTIEDDINEIEKRACSDCNKDLTDIEMIPLDHMQEADALKELSPDEVQAICYVAGYVERKRGIDTCILPVDPKNAYAAKQ